MKISKIDNRLFANQFDRSKSREKDSTKKLAVKRDELELTEKAKSLQKERDERFLVSRNEETARDKKKSVKRAEILPLKKTNEFVSRYSVGAE